MKVMQIVLTSEEAEALLYACALRYVHAKGRKAIQQADCIEATAEQIEETRIRELGWTRYPRSRFEDYVTHSIKRVTVTAYDFPPPERRTWKGYEVVNGVVKLDHIPPETPHD